VSNLRLYEIPEVFQRLEDLLLEAGGELTPEIEAVLAEAELAGVDKIEAAWSVVKHLQAFAESAKSEADRLAQKAKTVEASADRLKALILPAVSAMGGKVKGTRWTIFTTTRKGAAYELKPGRQFFELPGEWIRVRDPELNKSAIKDAIAKGAEIPDALVVVDTSTTFVSAR